MLLSKQIQKFIKQIHPAKLYHRAMYNTQCGLKNLNTATQVQSEETQLRLNEVYQRAYETFLDENYEESAKIFKQLKKLDPRNVHNQINYSIALQKSNKPYDSLKAIKKALSMMEGMSSKGLQQDIVESTQTEKVSPNPFLKASALAVKAQCLNTLDHIDEALKFYEEAASLNNQHYLALGNLCFEKQKYHKALSYLIRAANTKNLSLNEVMISVIKTLYELRLFKACFELSEKYSFIFHTEYEGMYFAGKSSYMLNNKEKAIQYLEMAVSIAPNQVDSVLTLSKILREEGQCRSALTHLQKFIAFDNTKSEIYLEAAENLFQLKENDILMREYLYQSQQLNENCLRSYILIAENTNNISEQLKTIEEGLLKHHNSHELIFLKSLAHQSLNNTSLQIKSLEKCVNLVESQKQDKDQVCQSVTMKYYQQLEEAYNNRLQQEDISISEINSLQSKVEQIKAKSKSLFKQIVSDQMRISELEQINSTDISSIEKLKIILQSKASELIKSITQGNQFSSIHLQLGMEYAKRQQYSQSIRHLEQIDSSILTKSDQIIINFLIFNSQFGLQDYQKSFEKMDQNILLLEQENFSQQLISNLKQIMQETEVAKMIENFEDLQSLKQFCKEQKEILLISLKLKNAFPQF